MSNINNKGRLLEYQREIWERINNWLLKSIHLFYGVIDMNIIIGINYVYVYFTRS